MGLSPPLLQIPCSRTAREASNLHDRALLSTCPHCPHCAAFRKAGHKRRMGLHACCNECSVHSCEGEKRASLSKRLLRTSGGLALLVS